MTPLQIELTRLIGNKELTFGCDIIVDCLATGGIHKGESPNTVLIGNTFEGKIMIFGANIEKKDIKGIIGHPATLSQFHQFIGPEGFTQHMGYIKLQGKWSGIELKYDVMKEFLEQDEAVLEGILSFIKENK